MKKIFIILALVLILTSCGKKSFEEVKEEASKKWTTKGEIEVIEAAINDKALEGEELRKAQVYLSELIEKREESIKLSEIEAVLPPRDGFKNGVAYSVIEYLKESHMDYDKVSFINGGNTLRLTNGLFYQDVRLSYLGNEETLYFLIKDNGYTSSSIAGVLENSDSFYDDYLKTNNLETATDEVYDYYFPN